MTAWSFKSAVASLRWMQVWACGWLFVLVGLMSGWFWALPDGVVVAMLFAGSLSMGFSGGRQFSLSVFIAETLVSKTGRSAGLIYGLDVLGAAGGCLLGGILFIPILGMGGSLTVCVLLTFVVWGLVTAYPKRWSGER